MEMAKMEMAKMVIAMEMAMVASKATNRADMVLAITVVHPTAVMEEAPHQMEVTENDMPTKM